MKQNYTYYLDHILHFLSVLKIHRIRINTINILKWSSNEKLKNIQSPVRQEILCFCFKVLKEKQPRDDYEGFLKLVIINLGDIPPGGVININIFINLVCIIKQDG